MEVYLKTTKYNLIIVTSVKGGIGTRFRDAEHSHNNGVHIIEEDNKKSFYPTVAFSLVCTGEQEKDSNMSEMLEQAGDLDDLIDAGNELHRLVCDTRDSIFDSNTIVGTAEFPDDEDGREGKAWWKEFADAAQEWNVAAGNVR